MIPAKGVKSELSEKTTNLVPRLNLSLILGVALMAFSLLNAFNCQAQIDPKSRSEIEFGYDEPLEGQDPLGAYAFYYYNNPNFLDTNKALRVVVAVTYADSELGFKHLLSPTTDVGIDVNGGGFADNYYEVRQGKFRKGESFDGYGGGGALNLYQLLDPGRLIPLNLVARGGLHDATYERDNTAAHFVIPDDQVSLFTRVGLRLAGTEPVLYPDLGLELSVWYEHDWRPDSETYGFNNDRGINPNLSLYWLYGGLNYAFTNTGQKIAVSMMAAGSQDADRLGAWRLGGDLPLNAEFPVIMPGYYYEELTAQQFVYFYGAYSFPLEPSHRWNFRLEAATVRMDALPGFEQRSPWQTGAGGELSFAPKRKNFKIVLRYGYGFNAIRDGSEGAQSIGLLFQYNFLAKKGGAE